MHELNQTLAEKHLDILMFLGVDTTNLEPERCYSSTQTGRITVNPFCLRCSKTGTWMYDIKEMTGDIEPNISAGAVLTEQMYQYNKRKCAEVGIEI